MKVEICIQRATSRFEIIRVTSLYCKHQNFISLHLKSLFQSQNDMKYELFHNTPVPYMYVCVPLKPVLLGNHSLLFLQNLGQWYLEFKKKTLIGTEFRAKKYFCLKMSLGPKIVSFFEKKKIFSFSLEIILNETLQTQICQNALGQLHYRIL